MIYINWIWMMASGPRVFIEASDHHGWWAMFWALCFVIHLVLAIGKLDSGGAR